MNYYLKNIGDSRKYYKVVSLRQSQDRYLQKGISTYKIILCMNLRWILYILKTKPILMTITTDTNLYKEQASRGNNSPNTILCCNYGPDPYFQNKYVVLSDNLRGLRIPFQWLCFFDL